MRGTAVRLAWFAAVGMLATAVHYAAVVLLVRSAGWTPIPANVMGWLISFACSFGGHFLITFRHEGVDAKVAAQRFFVVSALGFAANQAGYALLLHTTAVRYDVAVIIVSLAVAGSTYVLSRLWAFRPGGSALLYSAPAPALGWRRGRRPELLLHAAGIWVLALYAWQHPLPNWDIIPYAALARSQAGIAPQALSREAYRDVQAYVGEQKYRGLVEGADEHKQYRDALHDDPAALQDNLRLYSVKPLYVWLSRLAVPLTGNGASAAVLVSAVAMALLFSVFPFFFRRRVLAVAGVWLLLLAGEPPITLIASCATPDTLSALLVICCALLAIRRSHSAAVGLLGLLAVLARPDAAIVLVPLLAGFAWLFRREGRAGPLLACAGLVFVLFVYLGRQGLPWSVLFWHTFVQREPFPSRITHHVSIAEYLAVVRHTAHALLQARPLLFITGGIALAVAPWLRSRRIMPFQLMAAVAAGNIMLHYLVFPIDEFGHERMFLGSYGLLLAAVLLAFEGDRPVAQGKPPLTG